MRRRDFITLFGGVAAWPPGARAQQDGRVRHIGFLEGGDSNDPDAKVNIQEFEKALQTFGWIPGQNLTIDYRWAAGSDTRAHALAKELITANPDVLLGNGISPISALRDQTHTIPIVFTRVSNPVELGFIANLAQPGGNITGFSNFEPARGGKWLQVLKQIDPDIARVAVMANPHTSALESYFRSVASAASSIGIEPVQASVHDLNEMERAIAMIGQSPGGGLSSFLMAS